MRLKRHGDGVTVSLTRSEARLLTDQLDELDELLASSAPGPAADGGSPAAATDERRVRARLFPDGHRDDSAVTSDFRDLTDTALVEARRERYAQCRADLGPQKPWSLAEDDIDRWLMTLNDIRLSLGTRLNITDDAGPRLGGGFAATGLTLRYYLATELLESLLAAIEGD